MGKIPLRPKRSMFGFLSRFPQQFGYFDYFERGSGYCHELICPRLGEPLSLNIVGV